MRYAGMHNQVFNIVHRVTPQGAKRQLKPLKVATGGTAGDLTDLEIAEIIKARSPRNVSDKAALACANYITAHPGGDKAGEALGGIQYDGHAVYHHTRNKPTVGTGVSVFFCDPGAGYAKILAVGNHIGAAPETYTIEWLASDFRPAGWAVGTRITL